MSREHTVRIEKDPGAKGISISVSPALAGELGLYSGQVIPVSFGLKTSRATVTVPPGQRNGTLRLSGELCKSLECPSGLRLHARPAHGGIKIGPVLGIFAPNFGIGRFGPHTPYIRSLVRYSRRMGIWTYVFSADDLDFDMDTTRGYYLSEGQWKHSTFPLPDVCYDRIPSRRIEALGKVKEAKQRLRTTPGLICFNQRFMDKWRVHKGLSGSPTAEQYLPKTKRYESSDDLRAFLSTHKRVFMKPTGGSQGQGIIKVTRESGSFSYTIANRGHGSARTYDSLASRLERVIGSRRYIIQQGLNLATVGGRHFDIRLLMQKDSSGKWLFTKIYARVAAPGRITSNISTGAEGTGMARVLAQAFGRRAKGIGEKVRIAGRRLAPEVELGLGQTLGELGLDMGVDTSGRVWLIEVNSKPFRHMTTETGSKLDIIRSVIRPLSYTLGLSGFHKMKVAPIVQPQGGEETDELGG